MNLASVPPESSPLERLKALNRARIVLEPRGIPVGLALLPLAEAFDAKMIPTAVTNRVLAKQAEGGTFTEDELVQVAEDTDAGGGMDNVRAFVARSIETLWDEPVTMTADDTRQFSDEEFATLLRYCTREEPLPGLA